MTATSRFSVHLGPAEVASVDRLRGSASRAAYARTLTARLVGLDPAIRDGLLAYAPLLPEDDRDRARLDVRLPRPLRRALRRWGGGYPVGDILRGAITADAAGALQGGVAGSTAPTSRLSSPRPASPQPRPKQTPARPRQAPARRLGHGLGRGLTPTRLDRAPRPAPPQPKPSPAEVTVRQAFSHHTDALLVAYVAGAGPEFVVCPAWTTGAARELQEFVAAAESGRIIVLVGVANRDDDDGDDSDLALAFVGLDDAEEVAEEVASAIRASRRDLRATVRVHAVDDDEATVEFIELNLRLR